MSQKPSSGGNQKTQMNSKKMKIWSAAAAAVIVVVFAVVELLGGPALFSQLIEDTSSGASYSEPVEGGSSAEQPVSAPASVADSSEAQQSSSEPNRPAAKEMKVHFLDVGQADCIVVQLPNDRVMVIDGGNNGDGKPVVAYLQDLGIKTIDYLIGTHPHEDHIGGLDHLIRSFAVKRLYMPKVSENLTPTTATYRDVLEAAEKKNIKIKSAKAGITLFEDAELGLKAEMLSPNASSEYSDLNNYSAVIRLTYGSNSFMLTGDAEEEAEKIMLESGAELSADVLKMGHHGSSSSSCNAFLDAVAPKYAIISCETGNDYGHPHKETMQKLKKRSIEVFRTDRQQTVIATCDGTELSFLTGQKSANK